MLIDRWCQDIHVLTDRAGTDPVPGDDQVRQTGRNLLGRWSEAQRRYHTTQHLAEVLSAVDELERSGELTDLDAVTARTAAWYHDAVYRVDHPGGNEEQSAELARQELPRLGVDHQVCDRVARMVLGTRDHISDASTAMMALTDADLWILAAGRDRFDEYCRQVRAEYHAVPADRYARARTEILRDLLDRSRLYATDWAREHWSAPATANLKREIRRLTVR